MIFSIKLFNFSMVLILMDLLDFFYRFLSLRAVYNFFLFMCIIYFGAFNLFLMWALNLVINLWKFEGFFLRFGLHSIASDYGNLMMVIVKSLSSQISDWLIRLLRHLTSDSSFILHLLYTHLLFLFFFFLITFLYLSLQSFPDSLLIVFLLFNQNCFLISSLEYRTFRLKLKVQSIVHNLCPCHNLGEIHFCLHWIVFLLDPLWLRLRIVCVRIILVGHLRVDFISICVSESQSYSLYQRFQSEFMNCKFLSFAFICQLPPTARGLLVCSCILAKELPLYL